MDVIIARYGYVCDEGRNRLRWILLCEARRSLTKRLAALRRVSGVVIQEFGDTEAAGVCPPDAIGAVLKVLEPYRRRPAASGRSADAMRALRRRSSADGGPNGDLE
jgi:hypothetical protein